MKKILNHTVYLSAKQLGSSFFTLRAKQLFTLSSSFFTLRSSLFILIAFFAVSLSAQIDRSVRPSAASAKEVKMKDAQTFTLANGLKVFVVEDRRTPTAYYSLSLDIKPELEGEKAGMQDLFSTVFGTATKKRSKEQLNKDIDLIGAYASVGSRGGNIAFLKKYEQKALEIISDMLFNPLFTQEELDLNLEKTKSALAMIGDDAGLINSRVSAALVYGKHYPSGEVETVETVEKVTLDDFYTYYNTYFAPNVSRLVVVGDVTLAEVKANAEKYFGKWKKKTVPVAKYRIPEAPAQTVVAMVEKAGVAQSSIDISYPVQHRTGAADEVAVALMNHIFGGGGGSGRLFLNLRETHSYTYGVYSDISKGELVGRFSLTSGRGAASVKATCTDSAICEILHEIDSIVSVPINEQELKDAKAYFAGSFGRALAEPSTIASYALNIDKYKLPKDYYKNYLKRLEAVTVADIQAAARKYLRPHNAWIVVTADKSQAESLKKFAACGTVHFYDLNANPVAAPETKTADASAESIVEKYLAAIGGREAIAKVNDYEMVLTASVMGQSIEMRQVFKKPHFSLTGMSMGGMEMQKVIFNGSVLKTSGMGGAQEFSEGAEFDAAKSNAVFCPEQNYADGNYRLTVKGIETLNGKDAYVLEVQHGETKSVEYYDIESGLKVKTQTSAKTPQGEMLTGVEYSDYQEVDGIKFPYSLKQSLPGGMNLDAKVKSIVINKGIDDAEFK